MGGTMTSPLFDKRIWRIQHVAEFLGVSKGHIYNLVNRREIPFLKKGKILYFIPLEVENWLHEGRKQ
jgi:excisionase family DNA binding protein